jgi:methionine-gamma-lyase
MRKTAEAALAKGRVGLTLVETPANPTNGLVDLAACAAIADELAKSQGHRQYDAGPDVSDGAELRR